MTGDISRSIFFYEIQFFNNGNLIDPEGIFKRIDSKGYYPHPSGRYQQIDDSRDRSMFVYENSKEIKCSIGNRRKKDLPPVEEHGVTSPLTLTRDQCLFEASHFIIFKHVIDEITRYVIGMEYNMHAPRHGGLKSYITTICDGLVDNIDFIPLIYKDVLDKIEKSKNREIKIFTLGVKKDAYDSMETVNSNCYKSLQILDGELPVGIDEIELVLRTAPRSREGFVFESFFDGIKKFFESGDPKCKDAFAHLKYSYKNDDGRWEPVDILEPHIMRRVRACKLTDDSNSVDPLAMFAEICQAHSELNNDIRKSLQKT